MTAVKPLYILFWLAVSAPLLALIPHGQDPADPWAKDVDVACNAKRYGLRVAAAAKVAKGGGAAVPAIRGFVARHGANALPVNLVEEIANHDGTDAPVVELLLEWAVDRDFFWRAQAMKGLALRAPRLADGGRATCTKLFAAHRDDAAWLMRVHARLGDALLLDAEDARALDDPDPRTAPKLCALLLQNGRTPNLQPLFDALLDERTFQGVPWGQHRASDAFKAIKGWLGDADPFRDGKAIEDKQAAVEALLAAARTKSGQALNAPAPLRDERTVAGGIEILSCKHGDLFLQWTADGEVCAGLGATPAVKLPAPVWDELSRERAALELETNHGVVICDNLRLCWTEPAVHTKVAPASLPAAAAKWLSNLAKALHEADQPRLSEALRAGLGQFGPP